jgi:hypothetical protein
MIWLLPLPSLSPYCSPGEEQEQLADGRGGEGGVRENPNHATARRPGHLYIIQYSLLSSLKRKFTVNTEWSLLGKVEHSQKSGLQLINANIRPKAREMTQHGGLPGWLDPAG